jgi:hypothetical protein
MGAPNGERSRNNSDKAGEEQPALVASFLSEASQCTAGANPIESKRLEEAVKMFMMSL